MCVDTPLFINALLIKALLINVLVMWNSTQISGIKVSRVHTISSNLKYGMSILITVAFLSNLGKIKVNSQKNF